MLFEQNIKHTKSPVYRAGDQFIVGNVWKNGLTGSLTNGTVVVDIYH